MKLCLIVLLLLASSTANFAAEVDIVERLGVTEADGVEIFHHAGRTSRHAALDLPPDLLVHRFRRAPALFFQRYDRSDCSRLCEKAARFPGTV